jgi:hypothetical protein
MIETVENRLKRLLKTTVEKESNLHQLFDDIADILLLHTEIAIGDSIRYTIEEIEFYYFKNGCFNNSIYNCSYPRNSQACDFLWHYSGVDICFESTNDSFGGVLIRSLKKRTIENGECTNDELIGGPMRCATDLTNTSMKTGNRMELVINEQPIKVATPQTTIRQGVEADYEIKNEEIDPKVLFCYYIPQDNPQWARKRKNVPVLAKESSNQSVRIVFKQKDVTDYYKDNPEDRILNLKKKLQKKNTR